MPLTIRLFGLEVLHISTGPDEVECDEDEGGGDCTTTPIGFAPSYGDQRWEQGPEFT